MAEIVNIVEKKIVPSNAIMLNGLPDVGLVGLIATSHMISELKLTELAHVDSDRLPPIVVLHDGLPYPPIRIFGNTNFVASLSETAIPADVVQPFARKLVEWAQSKNVKLMVAMGGLPVQNRQDIKEPRVFGAASNNSLLNLLSEKNIGILKSGYMVGPYALLMRYCAEKNVPAIALMAESFYKYPDPEAAAVTIREFSKVSGLKIDLSKLKDKGEEIRLRARDVMKRTERELGRMKKTQEYDLPLYI
ncbi:MAG: proteasome assembly chaperone family protein [Candidatus Bathyarchaeota archaeon]|jgi:uncharacterized protein